MLEAFFHTNYTEAGCDEAGRGCLAGPVTAAAVILKKDFYHPLLNDSKQLNESQRLLLRDYIMEQAQAWAIATASPAEIDHYNILRASMLAMHRALDQLLLRPELILVDGNFFVPYHFVPHRCFIKGDGRFAAIAAASVLAKTARDAEMEKLHESYPQYNWLNNKGYPTEAHRKAVAQFGKSPHHRQSFKVKS